jgi:hypothetical protein
MRGIARGSGHDDMMAASELSIIAGCGEPGATPTAGRFESG